MQNVVLIVHLILALSLIAAVLLQRSEGGGLGMGGGGGAMTGRAAATALGKLTWILAIAFICTSMTLTIFAAENAAGSSVMNQLGVTPPASNEPLTPAAPSGDNLLPPPAGGAGDAPLVPTLE